MTKIQNPIIGRARGSAGGMTFAKQFDKNTMRAKPFEVANPKTAAQTNQRTFFRQVQDITASVSDDQLRSLFGMKPKGMSRRNMLSKQIAAANSIVNGQKVVDFSKIIGIGNGEAVSTPLVGIVEAVTDESDVFNMSMLNVTPNQSPNLIVVIFDTDNDSIICSNSNIVASNDINMQDVLDNIGFNGSGYGYLTCASDGSDVSEMSFGSFTIKTRREDAAQNAASDTPLPGNTVTVTGTEAGSTATLNFGNYQFNNLMPGLLSADRVGEETIVDASADWTDNDNGTYSAEIASSVQNNQVVYLHIEQDENVVETVPFRVIVSD